MAKDNSRSSLVTALQGAITALYFSGFSGCQVCSERRGPRLAERRGTCETGRGGCNGVVGANGNRKS